MERRPGADGEPESGVFRHARFLLYTQNPFYFLSALLVLFGAQVTFQPSDNPWALLALLSGYTSVLALAGVLLIRWLRVWDDARSILLVTVLLFLAIAVSFDEVVLDRPAFGTLMLSAGLVFSVGLSEALLRGAGIRLGWRGSEGVGMMARSTVRVCRGLSPQRRV